MKKKILFIMPSMFIGGAERSLLGLLENIDYTKADVSLFLYRHEGEFMPFIPEQVHLLPPMDAYATFDVPIKSLLLSRKFFFGAARLLSKLSLKLHTWLSGEKRGTWMSMQYTARYLQPLLPGIPGSYDMAVMFLGVADTLINKVDAKVKLAWCHTDYDTLGPDRRMDLEIYRKLDGIVGVSDSCSAKIAEHYPEIAEKVMTIENVLAAELIRKQAKEPIRDMPDDGSIRLLSIGRFSHAKNFDNVPQICRMIRETGLNVTWYLIGYGGDETQIRNQIIREGMEEHVIILGLRDNPYPYLAQCSLYIQPSRFEGKCVAVREAQILEKPVVITRYATSADQLEEGVDGVIVPMDNEGCAAGIAALLRDPEKRKQLSKACSERNYSNSGEAEKLLALCTADHDTFPDQ